MAGVLLVLGVLLYVTVCYLQYAGYGNRQVADYLPPSADQVAAVENPDRQLRIFVAGPWKDLVLPFASRQKQRKKRNRGNGGEPPKTSRSLTRHLSRLHSAVLCRVREERGGYLAAGRTGFLEYMGLRWGMGYLVDRLSSGGVSTERIRGRTVYRSSRGGRPFFLWRDGPFLFFSDKKDLVKASLGTSDPSGESHPAAKEFSETEPDPPIRVWADKLPVLDRSPVRELVHWFRADQFRNVFARASLTPKSVTVRARGSIPPDRYDDEIRENVSAMNRRARRDLESMVPADGTLFLELTNYPVRAGWNRLLEIQREQPVAAVARSVREEATMIYSELSYFTDEIRNRGRSEAFLRALSPPAAVLVRSEPDGGRQKKQFGGALLVHLAGRDGAALRILDEIFLENDGGLDRVSGVTEKIVRDTKVRVLEVAFEKWGEGLAPCYAKVGEYLVVSTSLSLVRDLLRTNEGRMNRISELPSYRFPGKKGNRQMGFWLHVRRLAKHLFDTAGSLAQHRMNSVDERALRRSVREDVLATYREDNRERPPERVLRQEVTEKFRKRRRKMQSGLQDRIREVANRLRKVRIISGSIRFLDRSAAKITIRAQTEKGK